ncbi:hypothetical protein ACJ6WD_30465 [Streptomyces sp. VTCC 41912]|uniref:hypothetical protein n=1 Tax=Streptomyces sp. VTCC 41912 TaxID=3383243 RepID=UPI003896E2E2
MGEQHDQTWLLARVFVDDRAAVLLVVGAAADTPADPLTALGVAAVAVCDGQSSAPQQAPRPSARRQPTTVPPGQLLRPGPLPPVPWTTPATVASTWKCSAAMELADAGGDSPELNRLRRQPSGVKGNAFAVVGRRGEHFGRAKRPGRTLLPSPSDVAVASGP